MGTCRLAAIIMSMAVVSAAAVWAQTDVENSQDHPLVSRMPGSYISDYHIDDFTAFDPTVIGGKSGTCCRESHCTLLEASHERFSARGDSCGAHSMIPVGVLYTLERTPRSCNCECNYFILTS